METRPVDVDKIDIKQTKGVWLRLLKVYPKCRLPILWILAYILMSMSSINIGLSETEYTAQLFAGDTSAELVTKLIAAILLNTMSSGLLIYLRGLTEARIDRNMRLVLQEKVSRLPMSYFQDTNPRDEVYRISSKAIFVQSSITLFILPVATCLYSMAKVVTRIFSYDWRLSLVMLGLIPLNILVAFLFGRINFFLAKRETTINTRLTRKLAEMITNIPLAKAFAKEEEETERGKSYIDRLYRLNIKSSWLSQVKDISDSLLSLLLSVAICLVGYLLIGSGEITKRAWISFFLFSGVFSGSVTEILMYWQNIKTIQGGADDVCRVMEAEEENYKGEPCPTLSGDIEIKNLHFSYTEDKPVLKGFSCHFPATGVTALLGESGCGKTTLTHLICRLYTPQAGEITVGGKDIQPYALKEYRKQFMVVSQNSLLFSGTIRENLSYGQGHPGDEALYESLKQAGAYDFVIALPEGLDTPLTEYGGNLSGGQKQRLTLARAMLSQAPYLILDEPIAAMDALATAEFLQTIRAAAKDRCVILISHTDAALKVADHAVIIQDGVLDAEGSVQDLAGENEFLRALSEKGVSL